VITSDTLKLKIYLERIDSIFKKLFPRTSYPAPSSEDLSTPFIQEQKILKHSCFKIIQGIFAIFSISSLMILGGLWWNKKSYQPSYLLTGRTHALLHLKIIDYQGHAVSGVEVRSKGHYLGSSDTYGNWERFFRVNYGDKLIFFLKNPVLPSIKEQTVVLTIPQQKPKTGEISLHQTINIGKITQQILPHQTNAPFEYYDLSIPGASSKTFPKTKEIFYQNFLSTWIKKAEKLGWFYRKTSPWKIKAQLLTFHQTEKTSRILLVQSSYAPQQNLELPPFRFLVNQDENIHQMIEEIFKLIKFHFKPKLPFHYKAERWYYPIYQPFFGYLLESRPLVFSQAGVSSSQKYQAIFHRHRSENFTLLLNNKQLSCDPNICHLRMVTNSREKCPWKILKRVSISVKGVNSDMQMFFSGIYAQQKNRRCLVCSTPHKPVNITIINPKNKIVYRNKLKIQMNRQYTFALPYTFTSKLSDKK